MVIAVISDEGQALTTPQMYTYASDQVKTNHMLDGNSRSEEQAQAAAWDPQAGTEQTSCAHIQEYEMGAR